MHYLTEGESMLLLELLSKKYGRGYSDEEEGIQLEDGVEAVSVAKIQGKLSIAKEAGRRRRLLRPSDADISATGKVVDLMDSLTKSLKGKAEENVGS